MKKDIHTKAADNLFAAILSLKNEEECYKFFEDICTINELHSLADIQAAVAPFLSAARPRG